MNDWRKLFGAILLLLVISLIAGCPRTQWQSPAPDRDTVPDTVYTTEVVVDSADTLAVDSMP